jgi:transposase
MRVNGNPKHVNILELGSLSDIPLEKHKALADRIEQLILYDSTLFEIADTQVEEWAHFFFRKMIKSKFNKKKLRVDKKIESQPVAKLERLTTQTEDQTEDQIANIQVVDLDTFDSLASQEIGAEWLCTQAIKELGLDTFLAQELKWNANEISVAMLALLGRLLYPASELKTADWLNENSGALELFSPESGTVDRNRLMQSTKLLYQSKDKIEKYLSDKISSIYKIDNKLILYDLTNTHFEGMMKECPKAKFGRNKQKRSDCRQITLGLLTDQDGFCKQSRYYSGNISETKTFDEVLKQLDAYKNQDTNPVIVMDAGISSEDNLKKCLSQSVDYICVSRAAHNNLIARVEKDKLVSFINKGEQEVKAQFFYQNIEYQIGQETHTIQETLLYIETLDKQAKEQGIFSKKQQSFETGLTQIKESVTKPQKNKKNLSIETIHQRIGRLKEKYSGIGQTYTIDVIQKDNQVTDIQWTYNENNAKQAKLGTYFIRTSIKADQEELLWKAYRTLGEIESTFRTLKSDLDLRPIFHQKELNIEAHLNLAVLSYFIVSFIRYRLKQSKLKHCWREIVRIMKTQKCNLSSIINKLGQKIILKNCTRASLKAKKIYDAMNYKSIPFYSRSIILKK